MAIRFSGIAFTSKLSFPLSEISMFDVSIIVDELSTRHLNLLHTKSILHFR